MSVVRPLWKRERRDVARALLGAGISFVLLLLALRGISLGEVLGHLARTRWDLMGLAMVAGIGMMGVRGVRWRYLFHPEVQGPWLLAAATTVGYMANNLLPLRAGELIRAQMVAQRGRLPFLTVMATIAVERVLDLLTLLIVLGVLGLVVPVPAVLKGGALALLAVGVGAMTLLGVVARTSERVDRWLPGRLRRWKRCERWLRDFSAGARCLTLGAHLVPLVVWTVLLWAINVSGISLAMQAAGLELPRSAAFTVLVFVGLGVALPSGPGYLGNVQFFAVSALALYGVVGAEAVSFSVLVHAANFIPITVVGAVLAAAHQLSPPSARADLVGRITDGDSREAGVSGS